MKVNRFVESLYCSDSFTKAFQVYEKEIQSLGFDGVLYTYIPRALVDHTLPPVYQVSSEFPADYLNHYASARFDKNDPMIKAVESGETQPLDWWGPVSNKYVAEADSNNEVIATARSYGINNGMTLPLMSGHRGISGASFISGEKRSSFELLLGETLDQVNLCTRIFHSMVYSDAQFSGQFVKPLLNSLSETEKKFLMGLAAGKSPAQIAAELNRTEKYLEQVMLKIRRKLSGVGQDEAPVLNRNQILYYAGLLNILEFPQMN